MSDLNLEYVEPHDLTECEAGLARLRGERDEARQSLELAIRCAVGLEQELAEVSADLTLAVNRLALYDARQERLEYVTPPDAHVMTGQDEIGGVGV